MLDALTKAHIFFKYREWGTDAVNQGHSSVSFRLHGTKIR